MATMDYSKSSPFTQREGAYLAQTQAGSGIFENFLPENFKRSRAANARQRAGGNPFRISVYGDSNSNGYQAQDLQGMYSRGYAERARGILEGEYGPSRVGIINPRIAGANSKVDQRFVLGTGWTEFNSPSQGMGQGGTIQSTGATAGYLEITLDNVDSFDVYYPTYSGSNNTVAISIDAEAATIVNTVSAVGSETMGKTTVTTAVVGTHTLRVKTNSAVGIFYFTAVEGFDSTKKGLRWTACGISGGTASHWISVNNSTVPWDPSKLYVGPSLPAPDLTFVNLSINDHNGNTTYAAYMTKMRTFLTNLKVASDVIIVASAAGGNNPGNLWENILGYQRELALEFGCGLINMQSRWGGYTEANGAPYLLWADPDHPTIAGYWDLGQATAEAVRLALGRTG